MTMNSQPNDGFPGLAGRFARNPFEAFLALVFIVASTSYGFGHVVPGSLDTTLPHWFLRIWGLLLFVGGVSVILGIAVTRWRRIFPAGLFLLAGGILVYSVALFDHNQPHIVIITLGTNIALAIACITRARNKL